jgi:16S rRNA (adenine1518-N6/adenine1519-N6)-dimethyltransferase
MNHRDEGFIDVPSLLRRYNLRPDKKLGQNFLIDPNALQQVVDSAGVGPDDTVLEVGPGLGGLTRLLSQRARKVIAVELDSRLIPALEEILGPFPNVELVHADILAFDPLHIFRESNPPQPAKETYKVVANIPYYITSALIRHLIEAPIRPSCLVLTIQKEVAERITAQPDDMNLLALSVQVYGNPQITARIPASAFYPSPEVESAVIRIDIYRQPVFAPQVLESFFRLAKAGFSQKRKTLRNALSGGLGVPAQKVSDWLVSNGIDPNRRAETLSLKEWGELALAYSEAAIPSAR